MPFGIKTVATLALLAAVLASVLDGGGPQASATAGRANVSRASANYPDSHPRFVVFSAGRSRARSCPLVVNSTAYVNPLAEAAVKPERIDQGVDYAGSGMLTALGAARLTYVATSGTGWPGAFIEYRLLDGPDAGCFVFYAEGVIPIHGLRVGDTVNAGQPIATIITDYPTGIEIGWGAGRSTTTYAAAANQWNAKDDGDNVASAAGKNFSELIAALGGPPGKVEG
jgi:hypothetical protein